jgi:multidrug efflux pump subunit AcrA (membrane-fusion protein)
MSKLFILPVLAILFFFTSCTTENTLPPPPALLTPVSARMDTAVVTRGPVAALSKHTGITRVKSESLSFGSVANRFGNFYVHIGDYVSEGQLLAELDTSSIERGITEQTELIARMREENAFYIQRLILDMAVLTYEYAAIMREAAENYDGEAMEAARLRSFEIMRIELSLELAQERQALALRHAEERLAELRANLSMAEIRAPFDGVITYLSNFESGQWVSSFSPVVFISNNKNVFVEYMGSTLQHPSRAVRIKGHINGEVYDLEHRPLTAVEQLYYQSRLGRIPIHFKVPDDVPLPLGAYVSIDMYSQWLPDTLRIPSNSLFHAVGQGFYAYKLDDGQLTLVMLEVGPRTDTFTAIISGLEEGDEVFVRP